MGADWIDITYLNSGEWDGADTIAVKLTFGIPDVPPVEFAMGPLETLQLLGRLTEALRVRERERIERE